MCQIVKLLGLKASFWPPSLFWSFGLLAFMGELFITTSRSKQPYKSLLFAARRRCDRTPSVISDFSILTKSNAVDECKQKKI